MAAGRLVRPRGGDVLELWLIRHGETDGNAQLRIHGSTDTPLNEHGLRQARRLAARLEATHFDAVYASDLSRARVTAETALPEAKLRFDARLREMNYGDFEGKTWAELDEVEAERARHWREDPFRRRVPGGESYGDVMERVASFRADLPEHGRVAAFSHGGIIRSALYGVIGQPSPGGWRLAIDNTSITRLRFGERGVVVVTLNDHAHLAGTLDRPVDPRPVLNAVG